MEKKKADGGIWEALDILSITIGNEKYVVKKVENKESPKHPDWKGEKIGIWDRISKKNTPYKFLRLDDKTEYVAFKNRFAKGENAPNWQVFKSEPRAE